MQSLMTVAIDSIAAVALIYFATGLAIHLCEKFAMPRRKASPGQLEIDFSPAAVEPASQLIDPWELPVEPVVASPAPLFPPMPYLLLLPAVEPIALLPAAHTASLGLCPTPRMTDAVMPFTRRQNSTPDWTKLTPAELRKACQQRGIKWRDVHGKSKHLKKFEMVQRLAG
jgi:hypothetical protein